MSLAALPADWKKPAPWSEMTASIPDVGTNASALEKHEGRFSHPQNVSMRITHTSSAALWENAREQSGIPQPGPLLARRGC